MASSRISLQRLLLLILVIGVWSAYYFSKARTEKVQASVTRLRDLNHELYVTDSTRYHGIRLPIAWRNEYRFDVFLPEGNEYDIKLATDQVDKPPGTYVEASAPIEPGKHRVTLAFRADQSDRMLSLRMDEQEVYSNAISIERYVTSSTSSSLSDHLSNKTTDEPWVLYKEQFVRFEGDSQDSPGNRGILLWIDKHK